MTRKKVKLAYISNDSARKATFKKRKKGLMKKVNELSVLCGVDACAIVYSPYDTQPEAWPSPMEVQRVLAEFKKVPEMEQSKKMVNQESFLRQRITKANEQLKKQRKENREKEITQVMFQGLTGKSLHHLNMIDLNDLGWMIEQYLKEINKKIEGLGKSPPHSSTKTQVSASTSASTFVEEASGEQHAQKVVLDENMDNMQRQQWLMELMNPQDHLGFGGDEMMLPFVDINNNVVWSNPFYP